MLTSHVRLSAHVALSLFLYHAVDDYVLFRVTADDISRVPADDEREIFGTRAVNVNARERETRERSSKSDRGDVLQKHRTRQAHAIETSVPFARD